MLRDRLVEPLLPLTLCLVVIHHISTFFNETGYVADNPIQQILAYLLEGYFGGPANLCFIFPRSYVGGNWCDVGFIFFSSYSKSYIDSCPLFTIYLLIAMSLCTSYITIPHTHTHTHNSLLLPTPLPPSNSPPPFTPRQNSMFSLLLQHLANYQGKLYFPRC